MENTTLTNYFVFSVTQCLLNSTFRSPSTGKYQYILLYLLIEVTI